MNKQNAFEPAYLTMMAKAPLNERLLDNKKACFLQQAREVIFNTSINYSI